MFYKWLESNFQNIFSSMSLQDRQGGPKSDITKRLVAADAHEEEYGNTEIADRLRDPSAHLIQGKNGHLVHAMFTPDFLGKAFNQLRVYIENTYDVYMFLKFYTHVTADENAEDDARSLPYGEVFIVFEYQPVYNQDDWEIRVPVPEGKKKYTVKTTEDQVGNILADTLLKEAQDNLKSHNRELDQNDPKLKELVNNLRTAPFEKEGPRERLDAFIKTTNAAREKAGKPVIKTRNHRFDAPEEK